MLDIKDNMKASIVLKESLAMHKSAQTGEMLHGKCWLVMAVLTLCLHTQPPDQK